MPLPIPPHNSFMEKEIADRWPVREIVPADLETLQRRKKKHLKLIFDLRRQLQAIETILRQEEREIEKRLIEKAEREGKIRLVGGKPKKKKKSTLEEFWNALSPKEQEDLKAELARRGGE